MSSGRRDLRERLRIDRVQERATEFYERTVESSDDASAHGASGRGYADGSGSRDGRFELSTWLGSSRIEASDDEDGLTAGSDRSDDSSETVGTSPVDEDLSTESTKSDVEFDFRGWLAEGGDDVAALDGTATATGDASAAERTEDPSTETTSPESAASEPAGFDFAAWVRTGDTDLDPIRDPAETDEEPVEPDRERPEPTPDASEPVEAAESTGSGVLDPVETTSRAAESVRPGAQSATSVLEVHPVKAATLALFLAFVALAVLSMVGYLPPLGPSTGLAF